MTVAHYALGTATLLITIGSLAIAAVALRARYLPTQTGAPARLAESVLGLALLLTLSELLGAVGGLQRGPLTLACAAVGLTARKAVGGARPDRALAVGAGRAGIPGGLKAAALAAAAITTALWAGPTLQSFDYGIRGFDSLWYHLPFAASFAQTGQITSLRFVDVEYLSQFYPASAELIHAVGIVLLGRDTLSPALNLFWLWLSLLAAYCIGRPRGLGALTAAGAALAFATPMMISSQAGSAANDIVGVAFLLAAVALYANAGGERVAIVLAAIAAGLACATKLTLLAPVAALTIAVLVRSDRGRRLRASAATWLVPLVLAGGYWYLRNLIAVGNPLPWTSFGGLLPTPAAPLQQNTGFSVIHYLTDSHVLTHTFGPGLVAGLGPWWPLVLGAMLLGPLLCLAGPGSDRTVRALGAIALASSLAYLLTPETAAGTAGHPVAFAFNLRYAAPALSLSLSIAPLAPLLSGSSRRRRATVAGLGVIFALTAINARLWSSPYLPGALLIAALAAAFAAALVLRARLRIRRPVAIGTVAALIVVVAVGGYPSQRHYLDGRYAYQPGVSYLARVWALFRDVDHARVGVAGTFGSFFSYPLFGLDDSNRVQYIAARGPHGSFTPIRSCVAWRTAVDAGHYQYLVTTPGRDPWQPKPLLASPEQRWTASDPAAHVIYERLATGRPITVFELSGPLNPSGC